MKYIVGNIWDYHGKRNSYVGITTNGSLNKEGKNIMGKGIALQAKEKFKGIDYLIGTLILQFGSKVQLLASEKIFTFPTKFSWWQNSDIFLIDKGCQELKEYMAKLPEYTFYMVPPGTGCGNLSWEEVKPVLNKYFENDDRLVIVNYEELE